MESKNKPLTRREILSRIAKESELSDREVANVLDVLEQLLIEELQRVQTFKLGNLGRFKISMVAERNGYNPITRQPQTIPAHTSPKFTFSKQIKDALERAMNPNGTFVDSTTNLEDND